MKILTYLVHNSFFLPAQNLIPIPTKKISYRPCPAFIMANDKNAREAGSQFY